MSENKRYYWLKLQENFFDDDTIDYIENRENGEKYVLFYLKLCLKALRNEGKLMRIIANTLIPYDERSLAKLTSTDVDTVKAALQLFSDIGLVQIYDTGEIYLTQLNELVGTETDKAKYMRQKRVLEKEKGNNVTQMLPDCYQNVTQSIEYREQNLEKDKEFREREKSAKENFSVFMETVYNLITVHNSRQTEAKRKIAISKDLFTFESKEGRMLVDMIKSRTPKEIVSALKNYLFVANMKNTWVNMFTFNAFCKGIDKYLPEYFDYESFADYNIDYDHSHDVDLLFVNKMENEPRFDNYLFDKHVKEWIANGCPENEEYYKLQETWR